MKSDTGIEYSFQNLSEKLKTYDTNIEEILLPRIISAEEKVKKIDTEIYSYDYSWEDTTNNASIKDYYLLNNKRHIPQCSNDSVENFDTKMRSNAMPYNLNVNISGTNFEGTTNELKTKFSKFRQYLPSQYGIFKTQEVVGIYTSKNELKTNNMFDDNLPIEINYKPQLENSKNEIAKLINNLMPKPKTIDSSNNSKIGNNLNELREQGINDLSQIFTDNTFDPTSVPLDDVRNGFSTTLTNTDIKNIEEQIKNSQKTQGLNTQTAVLGLIITALNTDLSNTIGKYFGIGKTRSLSVGYPSSGQYRTELRKRKSLEEEQKIITTIADTWANIAMNNKNTGTIEECKNYISELGEEILNINEEPDTEKSRFLRKHGISNMNKTSLYWYAALKNKCPRSEEMYNKRKLIDISKKHYFQLLGKE